MEWSKEFSMEIKPDPQQISAFIDNPLWEEMNEFLKNNYSVSPDYSYSRCSAQPGWNVKYKKGGKSLCTLYPMDGYFIALVVVGSKEVSEVEMILPSCTEYVQELYKNTDSVPSMGMWLMINVTDSEILEDVKNLIQIRRKIKK